MKEKWVSGERIQDRYLVEKVFQGGMGAVFIVFDPQRRERHAGKSPREDKISAAGALARFVRETEIEMELGEHPNIVCALLIDCSAGSAPLLFLEYVRALTWTRSWLRPSIARARPCTASGR